MVSFVNSTHIQLWIVTEALHHIKKKSREVSLMQTILLWEWWHDLSCDFSLQKEVEVGRGKNLQRHLWYACNWRFHDYSLRLTWIPWQQLCFDSSSCEVFEGLETKWNGEKHLFGSLGTTRQWHRWVYAWCRLLEVLRWNPNGHWTEYPTLDLLVRWRLTTSPMWCATIFDTEN